MNSMGTKPASHAKLDAFMLEVADTLNSTLELETLLRGVADVVRRIIDYEIFAILLLNEKNKELRIRFQVGHPPEVAERIRVKLGQGITGRAAEKREAILVNDVHVSEHYIASGAEARSELAVPMISKNRVIGVIDIEAPQANYFTEEHKNVLTLIASRVAVAIENARLYTRVSRQAKTLVLLNEISRDLTSILQLDELFKRIGDSLLRIIDYQMFSVLLLNDSGEKLEHRFSLRFKESIHLKHDIPLGRGIVGVAAETSSPMLVPDVTKDPRYIEVNPETRSELAVPLIYKGKAIGVLDLEHTKRNYFTEEHMRTIVTLAAQVAIAIENARLYQKVANQERRLEQDLSLAHELQYRLLPQGCPPLGKADLAAKFTPARQIGGDLYEFIPYAKSSSTAVVIGDVSGKGAPAAIYAALVSGILRSHAPRKPGAAEMMQLINSSLAERPIEAQFISMIYALWDDSDRTLRIANSGLPRPMYCRQGKVERIEATGLPMGLFPVAEYDEFTYRALPGDVFVFFSDGILDAVDNTGESYGSTRLRHVIEQTCQKSATEIVAAIFKSVDEFVGGVTAFDDQTVVAIRVKDQTKRK
jgi:sigma-B regulation protein RsbU (phosphoserine phosphatase)